MIPVKQERSNDCLPACIASLLELPLGVVQNYAARADGTISQLKCHQRWLRRIGWTLVEFRLRWRGKGSRRRIHAPWLPMAVPCWCIVTARVGTGSNLHALVGRIQPSPGGERLELVHDPSPSPWPDPRPTAVAFLVPAIRARERMKPAPATGGRVLPGQSRSARPRRSTSAAAAAGKMPSRRTVGGFRHRHR